MIIDCHVSILIKTLIDVSNVIGREMDQRHRNIGMRRKDHLLSFFNPYEKAEGVRNRWEDKRYIPRLEEVSLAASLAMQGFLGPRAADPRLRAVDHLNLVKGNVLE